MGLPRFRAALQSCAALTGHPGTYRDFQTCLGGEGSTTSGNIAQVRTEKAQRLRAEEIPGVLGAVRTARCHRMSTGEGVGRGRTVYRT